MIHLPWNDYRKDDRSWMMEGEVFCRLERLEGRMLMSATLFEGLLTVEGTGGNDVIELKAGPGVGEVEFEGTVFDGVKAVLVLGLAGDDVIELTGEFLLSKKKTMSITLDGGAGDDRLVGSWGSDTIIGGEGVDTLDFSGAASKVDVDLLKGTVSRDGHGGRDTVMGVENLIGSAFADRLIGDAGANRIDGGDGADRISGGDGDDELLGGGGDDHIDGDDGDDWVWAGEGDDMVKGGMGDDVIHGADGGDRLWGEDGDDQMYGEDDDDSMWGGDGDDLLVGGGGVDKLIDPQGDNQLFPDEQVDPEPDLDPAPDPDPDPEPQPDPNPDPEPDPQPEPDPEPDIKYISEVEPNDSEHFANEYTLVVDEPLYLTGEASAADSDYFEFTAANDEPLYLNVFTDPQEPVTIRIIDADSNVELFSYSSEDLNAILGLDLSAGTTFYVVIESTSTTGPVTYYIDLLQSSV